MSHVRSKWLKKMNQTKPLAYVVKDDYLKLTLYYASRLSDKCTFKLGQRLAFIYEVFIKLVKPLGTVVQVGEERCTLLLAFVFIHDLTRKRQNSTCAWVTLFLHFFDPWKFIILQRQVIKAFRLLRLDSFDLLFEQISFELKLMQDVRNDVYKLLVFSEIWVVSHDVAPHHQFVSFKLREFLLKLTIFPRLVFDFLIFIFDRPGVVRIFFLHTD